MNSDVFEPEKAARDADLFERATKTLMVLGDNVAEVVDTLRRQEIRGVCTSPTKCAIAVYLEQELGVPCNVQDMYADVGRNFETAEWGVRVKLPSPVTLFILAFDSHAFPDLEADDHP